jgi:hypothetical protein
MISCTFRRAALVGAMAALGAAAAPRAQTAAPARVTDGAAFTASGAVVRPTDYREWVYLTSGLNMSYAPEAQAEVAAAAAAAAAAAGQPRPAVFDNVFVNRQSYRAFMQSGRWPEGTMFILELRRGERHVSIDTGGQTQSGIVGLEAAVKDSTRFASTGGWAYFGLGGGRSPLVESAMPNPPTASCYACHGEHTAVENTFVQFYPTLFEVAQRLGTVKPTYDPKRTVR